MKSSKLFSLNIYDFKKGLIVAFFTPIIVFAQAYFATGKLDIELKSVLAFGLSGLLAYLIKNFFSDAPALPQVSANDFEEENGIVGNRPNDRASKK
jgi:hypothetical protein